jgi:hypothetical protein
VEAVSGVHVIVTVEESGFSASAGSIVHIYGLVATTTKGVAVGNSHGIYWRDTNQILML